ncbi:GDYXXLXY domain-containing protein [Novosphingobium sp.]|uniref:GDYXXLXY domain-containing protein n=1 Tax=Novosphingobium sp. TaxID=1874826 RepID=UPI0025F2D95C|nr:GDYXXLXY domain-containing protein [Novosphingobium sp.]
MNRALLYTVALLVPLIGLGAIWLNADRLSRQGTEWDVPIQGYDPRDLLQGHYVQFQYDWPGLKRTTFEWIHGRNKLCITGQAPIVQRAEMRAIAVACPVFANAELAQEGRLYTSQAEASRLQDQLWDRSKQGIVRIRLRPDGHVTPLGITFRPRLPEPQAAP